MPVTSTSITRPQGRGKWLYGAILALPLVCAIPGPCVFAADLHAFWDSRCANCHRHAGEFARNHLKIKDGRLTGRNPERDVCAFLVGHGAGEALAGAVCQMLSAQSATPSLFKQKCAGCHETAADLARTGLVPGDGGALKGKSNGRELAEFLVTHGKLEAGELQILVQTLQRVATEVGAMVAK